MPFITMRSRGEVTIPGDIRKALALESGSVLEAYAEGNRIILVEAQDVVSGSDEILDDMLAESLQQIDRGETVGPFKSSVEWLAYAEKIKSIE